MERRELLVTASAIGGTLSLSGCLDGSDTEDSDSSSTDEELTTSPSSSTENNQDPENENDGNEEEEEEVCYTEIESDTETVVDRSREIEGQYQWSYGYSVEPDDRVTFDISASAGQDIEVEIDSPWGQTVYSESGFSLNTVHEFTSGGTGEVRVTNLGERTEEEREELWDDRIDIGAGNQFDPWAEIREGNRVDYYARMVDGARPNLRIEDEYGTVLREHSVAEVIDDTFTAPGDGRYYFIMENTALITSGTWDYTFERVNEVPIPTTVDLTIEREFDTEVDVCE